MQADCLIKRPSFIHSPYNGHQSLLSRLWPLGVAYRGAGVFGKATTAPATITTWGGYEKQGQSLSFVCAGKSGTNGIHKVIDDEMLFTSATSG